MFALARRPIIDAQRSASPWSFWEILGIVHIDSDQRLVAWLQVARQAIFLIPVCRNPRRFEFNFFPLRVSLATRESDLPTFIALWRHMNIIEPGLMLFVR